MFVKNFTWRDYNFRLIAIVILLTICGAVAIRAADSSYFLRQIFGICSGLLILAVVSLIDYHRLLEFCWILYFINLILLVLVKIPGIGVSVNGATRWINIGVQIQPSEINKIVLILFTAAFIAKYRDSLNTLKTMLKLILLDAVPIFLVLKQPNLSTTIITCVVIFGIIFAGGLHYKIILTGLAIVIPVGMIGLFYIQSPNQKLLKDYQVQRIMTFIDPEKYSDEFYQQENALYALCYGKLYGNNKSQGNSSVSEAGFLPEAHTDFIYAVVGQEFGFAGCCVILVLFLLLLSQGFSTAWKARDLEGRMICVGVSVLIGIQAVLNIAVVTAVMPNTGVTLPFVSYGLTSLWSMMAGIGLVINVGLQKPAYWRRKNS